MIHPFTLMRRSTPPTGAVTVAPELPRYDQQTQAWTYNGRTLLPVGSLLYDPATKKMMTTGYVPDPDNPTALPGIPDPSTLKVFASTYDLPGPAYNPWDERLLPIAYRSPLMTPTRETTAKVIAWLRANWPQYTHTSHTDPDTGQVIVATTDRDTWPVVTQGAGEIALKLDMQGVAETRNSIAAIFLQEDLR